MSVFQLIRKESKSAISSTSYLIKAIKPERSLKKTNCWILTMLIQLNLPRLLGHYQFIQIYIIGFLKLMDQTPEILKGVLRISEFGWI
ncbi:unnamed protein product [Rhizophagus irregularis]|uniref:Uncharacterized protein n=1 Tax=Rhizophagus irregularis TaxID=588596 RepID=A0A916EH32_9GLOM|nr:unnamed protein product [Rhizophagus irregularis]CAB5386881.1 unnamed protein product [Rhizophagus irregularis]